MNDTPITASPSTTTDTSVPLAAPEGTIPPESLTNEISAEQIAQMYEQMKRANRKRQPTKGAFGKSRFWSGAKASTNGA